MSLHRIAGLTALSLVFAALAAPAAYAEQDLRNPDTRDVAEGAKLDLRNPDTRDAAEAGDTSPEVTVVSRVPVAPPARGSGLDWGDAGIGAGAMLGLVLLAAAGILAVSHRRGASSRTATTG
jgi:hypothetical protein